MKVSPPMIALRAICAAHPAAEPVADAPGRLQHLVLAILGHEGHQVAQNPLAVLGHVEGQDEHEDPVEGPGEEADEEAQHGQRLAQQAGELAAQLGDEPLDLGDQAAGQVRLAEGGQEGVALRQGQHPLLHVVDVAGHAAHEALGVVHHRRDDHRPDEHDGGDEHEVDGEHDHGPGGVSVRKRPPNRR